jgi:polyisoprenoid-binding protein YceI
MRTLLPLAGLLLSVQGLAAPVTYTVDPVHSTVLFSTMHLNVSRFYGRFDNTTGTVVFDEQNPAGSKIELTVKTSTVSTWDPKRDEHLKSPDFFNAAQFPTITFVSKRVAKTGDKWSVTGDFTLHGVKKEITVDFVKTGEGDDPWGGHRAGWHSTFKIKRSDYGMNYMLDGIGDEIELIVSVEGTRK